MTSYHANSFSDSVRQGHGISIASAMIRHIRMHGFEVGRRSSARCLDRALNSGGRVDVCNSPSTIQVASLCDYDNTEYHGRNSGLGPLVYRRFRAICTAELRVIVYYRGREREVEFTSVY